MYPTAGFCWTLGKGLICCMYRNNRGGGRGRGEGGGGGGEGEEPGSHCSTSWQAYLPLQKHGAVAKCINCTNADLV